MATTMPTPFLSALLNEPPITRDVSPLLPTPINVSFTMPPTLRMIVESSFDKVFNGTVDEFRNRLLRAVQEVVEQQVSHALTKYSSQVAGCEGSVIEARRAIHEEGVSVNEKHKKLQDLVSENTRESLRLQEQLAQIEKERAQIKRQTSVLDKEKQSVKIDRSALESETAKLRAGFSEIKREKLQILQWQKILSNKELGLAERVAHEDKLAERAGGGPRVAAGTTSAADSLEEAKRIVEEKAPSTAEYHQIKRRVQGGAAGAAPMPIRIGSHDKSPQSASPRSEGPKPGWSS